MIRYTIRNTPDEVSLRDGVRELHPNPFRAALRRLAAYEDTDLTPEQVEALQEENVRLTTPDTVRINRLERIAKQVDEHGGIDHLVGLDVLAYMDAWEEIQKLIEQCEYADEPEEEDRHDGAVEVLVTWLLPVPTIYEQLPFAL